MVPKEQNLPSDCPEWKLVVAYARTRLDDIHRERLRALLQVQIDWVKVIEIARRHRVGPLLYCHLARETAGAMPGDILASLESEAAYKVRRCLLLAGQMTTLLRAFEQRQILAVPYKGPALASMAYGNFTFRDSEDLDFVLPQHDVRRAFEVLADAGYAAELDVNLPREAAFISRGDAGQYCFRREGNELVELHSERTLRYFPVPLDWDGLSRRLTTILVGGQQIRTFSMEDTIVLLSVHGAKHFWGRLGWICDIAELCQAPPGLDWELAEDIAERMGCRKMWLLALLLANGLLDAPLPGSVMTSVKKEPGIDNLVRRVQTQLFGPPGAQPSAPQRLFFRLYSHENLKQGVHQCIRVATHVTEEDWKSYQLPGWAAPAYLALRPLRLLRKHGLGLHGKTDPRSRMS